LVYEGDETSFDFDPNVETECVVGSDHNITLYDLDIVALFNSTYNSN
jgi:hypothetical protein